MQQFPEYTDKQRQSFQYFDGAELVYADPLEILPRILTMTHGKPNELAKKVFETDPSTGDVNAIHHSNEAALLLVEMVREVFSMRPYDRKTNQGAQTSHCLAVWKQFARYMAEQKKNTGPSPTTSMPTATPTDSLPITNATSASS